MFVLGKRGAASSMCKTIAASTSSFASRCFWPLHATMADGCRQTRKRNGIRRWCGWILSKHDLRRGAENRHAIDPSEPVAAIGFPQIRHWEVTGRVQKAFLSFFSVFWICLIFLIFLLTWRELAWVSWSVRRDRARSCEYVWIAQSDSGLIRRETSRARPDLAADSGCRRVRRARGRL